MEEQTEEQTLYGVIQEEMGGGSSLHGVVACPQIAEAWVQELIKHYHLTHFDEVQEISAQEPLIRAWKASWASWSVQRLVIHKTLPEVHPSPSTLLTLRLLEQSGPVDLDKLPWELRVLAQQEIDACGIQDVKMGHDDVVGWYVLHHDQNLVYIVDLEQDPESDPT